MAARRAEVIFVGDAASIVRAAKQAEAATVSASKGIADANARVAGSSDAAAAATARSHTKIKNSLTGFAASAKKAIVGVSEAGAAIGVVSVVAAAKFQSAMEMVHTQAGASQKEVDKLSKAVLNLAPKVGTGPDELAKGLYHLESQGLRGAKAMDTLKVAAEGAKIGNANLEDVTNALGGAVASGIKGVHNMGQAMGMLNATVGSGDMRMQDLADALGTGMLGPMKQFGVSLKDVGAALAVFGDNNIRGADAGTKLGSAIRVMAAPSDKAAKVLGGIGIGATELADKIRKNGLVSAFEDLKTHLKGTGDTASQQARVLTEAFGGKQATGILLLLGQLDRLKKKEKEVGDGGKRFGADWAATQKTFAFAIDQAKAAIETFSIKIGNAVIPVIQKFIGQIRDGKGAGGEFRKAFEAVRDTVVPAIQFVARTFTSLSGTMKIALGSGAALAALFAVGGPWLVGIAAVVAAATLIRTHWSQIKPVFDSVKASLVGFYNSAKPTLNDLSASFKALEPVFRACWAVFKAEIGFAFAVVKRELPGIEAIFRGFAQVIKGIVQVITGVLTLNFGKAWSGVKNIFAGGIKAAIGAIRASTAQAREAASRIGGAIVGIFHDLGGRFLELGKNLIQGFINGITSMAGGVISAIKHSITDAVPGFVKKALHIGSPSKLFEQFGKWTIEGFVKGLVDSAGSVTEAASKSLLFPIDAAITALTAKKDRLQSLWDAMDARAQRSSLVQAITTAQAGGGGSSSGGGGSGGASSIGGISGVKGGRTAPGLNSSQTAIARTILGVAARVKAPRQAIIAALDAAFGESTFNPAASNSSSGTTYAGVFQANPHAVGQYDTAGQALSFFLGGRGFQSGGAISLARKGVDPGTIATRVEASGEPGSYYGANTGKASAILAALGKGGGSGGSRVAASSEVAKNEKKIYDLRKKARDLPAGKNYTAERKGIQDQIAALMQRDKVLKAGAKQDGAVGQATKALKDFDTQAKRAKTLAAIDLKIKNLGQLKAFNDAISSVRDKLHGLASDAAGAFRTMREKQIATGADATELAGLQAQDAAEQDAKTTQQLNQDLADAVASGDVKAQKDAQDAIAAYARQKREQELTASIQSQQDGLDDEVAAYQSAMDAKLGLLADNLGKGEESYKQFVADVQKIMAPLGLGYTASPDEQAAIQAGAGPAGPQPPATGFFHAPGHGLGWGGSRRGRATGGPVQTYRVGELGPEDVVFGEDGSARVVQASQSRGGSGGIYMDFRGAKIGNTKAARLMANKLSYRLAFG